MSSKLWVIAAFLGGVALAGCIQATEPVLPEGASILMRDTGQSTYQVDAGPETLRLSTRVEVSERSMVTGGLAQLVLSVTSHEREPVTLRFGTCQRL